MTNGYQSFRQAMGTGVDYTFNWFYIDSKDISYQASCRCPQRAQGVDPYMPVWGTGQFDWQGYEAPQLVQNWAWSGPGPAMVLARRRDSSP